MVIRFPKKAIEFKFTCFKQLSELKLKKEYLLQLKKMLSPRYTLIGFVSVIQTELASKSNPTFDLDLILGSSKLLDTIMNTVYVYDMSMLCVFFQLSP